MGMNNRPVTPGFMLQCSTVWALVAFQNISVVFSAIGTDPLRHGMIQCIGEDTEKCESAVSSASYQSFCKLKTNQWRWLIPDKTAVSEFGLVCGKAWLASFSTMMFFLGAFAGCFLWYILADRLARRRLLFWGCMGTGVCGLLIATAPVLWTFILFRFFLGIGTTIMSVSAFVLAADVTDVSWRSFSGLFLQLGCSMGAALAAIITWMVPRWRWLSLICGILPMILTASTWSFMVESPSWLLNCGRKGEATSALAALAFGNQTRLPERPLADPSAILSNPHRYFMDIVRHGRLRRRILLDGFAWVAAGAAYMTVIFLCDTLTGNAHHTKSSAMELAFTGFLYEIPGIAIAGLVSERIGRKYAVIGGFFECGLTLLAAATTHGTTQQAFIVASRFGVAGAISAFYVLSWEHFPTILVYPAMAFLHVVGRGSFVASPWLAFAALRLPSGLVPLTICGALCIAASCVVSILPETLHSRIPETLQEFNSLEVQNNRTGGQHTSSGSSHSQKQIQIDLL